MYRNIFVLNTKRILCVRTWESNGKWNVISLRIRAHWFVPLLIRYYFKLSMDLFSFSPKLDSFAWHFSFWVHFMRKYIRIQCGTNDDGEKKVSHEKWMCTCLACASRQTSHGMWNVNLRFWVFTWRSSQLIQLHRRHLRHQWHSYCFCADQKTSNDFENCTTSSWLGVT